MEKYLEQVAGGDAQGKKQLLYFLVCMLMVILFMWALICFAGAVTGGEINWTGVGGFVVFGAAAAVLFRVKDHLRTEYEYIYSDGRLDVSSVMNNRRRRYLTRIELHQVKQCGPAQGPAYERLASDAGYVKHKWYADSKAALYYFYVEKKGAKHLMLLQLNNDMIELITKGGKMPRGVWHDAEGKTTLYGSLS